MSKKLSEKEIKQRLLRLSNLEELHDKQLSRNEKLTKENKSLKARIAHLEAKDKEKDTLIESLRLQVEELKGMVFGKRKKRQEETDDDTPAKGRKSAKQDRTVDSYRRAAPNDEEITKTERRKIDTCPDCDTSLEKRETRTFYKEDIVLPEDRPLKTVVKREIERGWCDHCRAWKNACPVPPAQVMLGKSVKLYICYLAILIRLSFSQIRTLLLTAYQFSVSEGEIAAILEKEARSLRPEYEALKERIRKQKGVHYDETSYGVAKEEHGNFAWVMTGTETNEAVFDCGKSRGKGVALELKGDADHVGISDGYVAYTNLFECHALCWAHPHRKLRDLSKSKALPDTVRTHCKSTFQAFAQLYGKVNRATKPPFDPAARRRARTRFAREFDEVATSHPLDPPPLSKIKAHLREHKAQYFTCLLHEGIPADNNKAERALRHLVLKRKVSFGSKTQKGAEAVSILASVILSLWWTKPESFFGELMRVRGV